MCCESSFAPFAIVSPCHPLAAFRISPTAKPLWLIVAVQLATEWPMPLTLHAMLGRFVVSAVVRVLLAMWIALGPIE